MYQNNLGPAIHLTPAATLLSEPATSPANDRAAVPVVK